MISWVIILIGVLAIAFISKLSHLKHKLSITMVILFLLFLVLSFNNVVMNNSVNLASPSGIVSAMQLYFSWLGQVLGNLQVVTGNVVRMDWSGNFTG